MPWAQEAPGSNPGAPTKFIPCIFLACKNVLHPKLHCGILAGRSSQFASRLVSESSPHAEFTKTRRGRHAIQRRLNGSKLNPRYVTSMVRIQGIVAFHSTIADSIFFAKATPRMPTRAFEELLLILSSLRSLNDRRNLARGLESTTSFCFAGRNEEARLALRLR